MYIAELGGTSPILHMVDVNTGLSATQLTGCRDITVAARTMETIWFNVHGAPAKLSGDPEFLNNKFKRAIQRYSITVEPRAARRHQKIGKVERKNTVVRKVVQRIAKDVEFMKASFGTESVEHNKHAILSRATFLSNLLYGSKRLSSFEISRGYMPSFSGLPSSKLATDMIKAHVEQVARRGLEVVIHGRTPRTLKPDKLPREKRVYFFRRTPAQPRWIPAYVREAQDHLVLLSTRADHAGKPVRAAYEDIRFAPENPMLHDLDCQEPIFPTSDSLFDKEDEPEHEEDEESEDPTAKDNQARQPSEEQNQEVHAQPEDDDIDFWKDPAFPEGMVDLFDVVDADEA